MNYDQIVTFTDYVGELTVNYRRTSVLQVKIRSSVDIQKFARPFFDTCMDDHEEIKILHLNNDNTIQNIQHLASGTLTSAKFELKDALRDIILLKTKAIIIMHNHPSGKLKPSKADIDITHLFKKACNLFDVKVLDHVIITREGYYSFVDEGIF